MAVVFDGISGDHWCPFVILITNNTTLVELAKPREHTDPDLVIHVQQIDHHPVLADQAVLDPPEIEARQLRFHLSTTRPRSAPQTPPT